MSPPHPRLDHPFRPSAALEVLRERARLFQVVRAFFHQHGYWEVDTPLLSRDGPVDPHLDPFPVSVGHQTYYLQTSPEFGMKRLLAAGADRIVQIGKNFRRGERGRWHNPEFTMIEWYCVGETYREQMAFVERLVQTVFQAAGRSLPTSMQTTYRDAFLNRLKIDVAVCSAHDLRSKAEADGVPPKLGDGRDGWLNFLLSDRIERYLGTAGPEFLYDYPASQSALSRIRHDAVSPYGDPARPAVSYAVAERFELYVDGIELCNGYTELTDPGELSERIGVESARRRSEGLPRLPERNSLLDAMKAGLPECAGVALGFDRLVMLALGCSSIDEVIPFPIERA